MSGAWNLPLVHFLPYGARPFPATNYNRLPNASAAFLFSWKLLFVLFYGWVLLCVACRFRIVRCSWAVFSCVDKSDEFFYHEKAMKKKRVWPVVIVSLLVCSAVVWGGMLGLALAATCNIKNTENFTDFETALPTRLLDINGELITEFASDEKREIIALNRLPQHMLDALLTREDRIFYQHAGFSGKAIMRAVVGKLTRRTLGGGSTLTQQIAGTLYCDRNDYSVKRKIKELWWAIQMERRYSKDEILELYLNKIYFGGGTYGVNAASKYYFGHSATEITPAEAALLVIQLSNPAYYNPFEHPNRAMERQRGVLAAMVGAGYIGRDEAEESFDSYWASFDYTRTGAAAYFVRDDKAPWFSEYVRRVLTGMFYGAEDIYTGGFTVNTTLNLSHQKAAEDIMHDYLLYANRVYQSSTSTRQRSAFRTYIPLTEMLSLVFNLPSLKVSQQRNRNISMAAYRTEINPVIDVLSLMCGMDTLKTNIVNKGNTLIKQNAEKTTIEGTMIALENETGYIDALVGGSKYDSENQFIRAVQARVQPGSTFKPLYYSAAIDSRKFNMTSIISDTPVVFHKEDGSPYIPLNFKGEWEGNVQLWYALAHSMNVPSLKVLDGIGFDAAIRRSSALLGIPENELSARNFQPVYPLGLGVCSVRPVEVARAFATIANNGRAVTPIAIRNVEDRNGNLVFNPEKDLRMEQQRMGKDIQVISPETAFIMQQMLSQTVRTGTLQYGSDFGSTAAVLRKNKGRGNKFRFYNQNGQAFVMPAGGKTGTTQNWADAWTVGFTPYYTAAFWFGFDRPGRSLGLQITGATLAGVAWGDFMHVANEGKSYRTFGEKPAAVSGLEVCNQSGDLYTAQCGESHRMVAYYLPGTEPDSPCEQHQNAAGSYYSIFRLQTERWKSGVQFSDDFDSSPLTVNLDFLDSTVPSSERAGADDGLFETDAAETVERRDNWFLD